MRIAALVAVPLLVAGCSHTGGGGTGTAPTVTTHRTAAASGSKPPAASVPRRRGSRSPPSSPGSRRVIPPIRPAITAVRDGATTLAMTSPTAAARLVHDRLQTHRRRAGMSGRVDQSPTPAGHGLRRVERRLGRLRRHQPAGRGGARRSGTVPQRQRDRTGQRGLVVIRRLPLPRRSSRAVLRELRPPVGGPVQRRRRRAVTAACGRCHHPTASASRSAAP